MKGLRVLSSTVTHGVLPRGTVRVPSPASGPRLPSFPTSPSLCRRLWPWRWPFLTCKASIDLVVAGPEPKDRTVQTPDPVHGASSHLLKVASALSAAKEEADVAPDGLEDLLGLGYREEETVSHRGPCRLLGPADPTTIPTTCSSAQGPPDAGTGLLAYCPF